LTDSDPRRAAFQVLCDASSGQYADRSAQRRLSGLTPRDRRFAMELAYGTIRLRGRLDTELSVLVSRPLERLQVQVLQWLRLGLYQLRETRVPPHAAVSESVAGVRATAGPRATGLVNAVLRRAADGGPSPSPFPTLEEDPVGYLTTWGSHPEWLVRRWLDVWPLADVVRLVENDNRPPAVTVRLLDPGAPIPAVDAEGEELKLEDDGTWPGTRVLAAGDPARLADCVSAVVQDPAASAVVDYIGADVSGPVLDVCAAPGGKAIGLSHLAKQARPFVAADSSLRRLRRSAPGVRALAADLDLVVADGRRPGLARAGTVLLDAPCTGTGPLRRRVAARWRVDEAALAGLVGLQAELLDASASVVEAGGLLVYSTCSIEAEENGTQVDGFLERHPEFRREPPPAAGVVPDEMMTDDGDLFVRPWTRGTDGSYAARLRKAGRETQ